LNVKSLFTVKRWGKPDLKIVLSQEKNIISETSQIAPNRDHGRCIPFQQIESKNPAPMACQDEINSPFDFAQGKQQGPV
jgi:hypothetical protein